MARFIRPSTTGSTLALWAKSLLNAVLFFVVFMVVLPWAAYRAAPHPVPLPSWLGCVGGITLFVLGAGVWLVCLDVFSRQGRGTPLPLDAPSRLVTSGPFAVIRNPIMAGELAVIWAEALYFGVLGVFVYAAATTLAAHVLVVRVEEPELRQRFGGEYDSYCRSVPRWLPRPRRPGSAGRSAGP